MTGREDKNANNLFFLCSLIEYIGRKTKNHRNVVVNAIGKDNLQHIFDLADVYHSENIDKLSFELTEKYSIENGIFDNAANAKYSIFSPLSALYPLIFFCGKAMNNLMPSSSASSFAVFTNQPPKGTVGSFISMLTSGRGIFTNHNIFFIWSVSPFLILFFTQISSDTLKNFATWGL